MSRLKILPHGEVQPLFTDLVDQTANTLVEAKGSVERGAMRMAIGQLADYKRFVTPTPRLMVLLPSAPREDLQNLLDREKIRLLWPDGDTFAGSGRELLEP